MVGAQSLDPRVDGSPLKLGGLLPLAQLAILVTLIG